MKSGTHELDVFSKKNLLETGWAGILAFEEAVYIKAQLRENAQLRRRAASQMSLNI